MANPEAKLTFAELLQNEGDNHTGINTRTCYELRRVPGDISMVRQTLNTHLDALANVDRKYETSRGRAGGALDMCAIIAHRTRLDKSGGGSDVPATNEGYKRDEYKHKLKVTLSRLVRDSAQMETVIEDIGELVIEALDSAGEDEMGEVMQITKREIGNCESTFINLRIDDNFFLGAAIRWIDMYRKRHHPSTQPKENTARHLQQVATRTLGRLGGLLGLGKK